MSPRIAFSAVVLPAPLGPMSPRMRPSSTRRSRLSSETVEPNTFRRPRASIQCISALLLGFRIRRRRILRRVPRVSLTFGEVRTSRSVPIRARFQQLIGGQAEPLNRSVNPWPFFVEKFLALALHQQIPRAGVDKHAASPPGFDQTFVYQLLIALENRERIDPVFRRDGAH